MNAGKFTNQISKCFKGIWKQHCYTVNNLFSFKRWLCNSKSSEEMANLWVFGAGSCRKERRRNSHKIWSRWAAWQSSLQRFISVSHTHSHSRRCFIADTVIMLITMPSKWSERIRTWEHGVDLLQNLHTVQPHVRHHHKHGVFILLLQLLEFGWCFDRSGGRPTKEVYIAIIRPVCRRENTMRTQSDVSWPVSVNNS